MFVDELGASASSLINAVPKTDFNGGHADPNLTYARDVCDVMGVDKTGAAMLAATPAPHKGGELE